MKAVDVLRKGMVQYMKKLNIILLLIAMLSLVGLGAVLVLTGQKNSGENGGKLDDYQDGYIENTGLNKDILVTVVEEAGGTSENVYDMAFQTRVREALDTMISEKVHDEDSPFVAYNPFGTNSQSLYVYFETAKPYAVSYSVHIPDSETPDFGGHAVPVSTETSMVHEFQITGLMPNEVNMITLRLTDSDGVVMIRRFYYQNPHDVAATEMFLEKENGTKRLVDEKTGEVSVVPASTEKLSDGLFVAFQKENELKPYVRLYDNDGIQRAEIPLVDYGAKRLLFDGGRMYLRVSEKEIAAIDRLGQVEQIYTADSYTFGADLALDKDNNLLVLASDQRQTSVNDCVLLIDVKSGAVKELFDMGDLLPDYKKTCKAENGLLDWIDLNSIDWEEGNQILLSAGKPGLLIKIRRLYNEPRIVYLVGDITPFEDTPYEELFLRVDNEFELHDGVNIAGILPYDKIRESRHYVYLLNNNRYAEYEKNETPVSYYYRYLIDEAEFGVRLMESYEFPGVGMEGSIQWHGNHLIANGDQTAEFCEYDSQFGLVTKFTYVEPEIEYTEDELEHIEDNPLPDGTVLFARVMKYDFYNYFFMEQPTIVVPADTKTEENELEE